MKAEQLDEFLAWKPPEGKDVIGGGLLVESGKMIIYGEPESFKSWIAMYTVFTIAQGLPWFKFETKQTTAYSVQMEIPRRQYQKRIKYYSNIWTGEIRNLWLSTEHDLILDKPYGFKQLTQLIQEIRPGLLVIDPLYKVMSGNINDSVHVKYVLDSLDSLAAKYNMAVILIHHPHKVREDEDADNKDVFMGSKHWRNWADTIIKVNRWDMRGKSGFTLKFQKNRHAEATPGDIRVEIKSESMEFKI